MGKRTQNLVREFAKPFVGDVLLRQEGQPLSHSLLRSLVIWVSCIPVMSPHRKFNFRFRGVYLEACKRYVRLQPRKCIERKHSVRHPSRLPSTISHRDASRPSHDFISSQPEKDRRKMKLSGTQRAEWPTFYPAKGQHICSHDTRLLL